LRPASRAVGPIYGFVKFLFELLDWHTSCIWMRLLIGMRLLIEHRSREDDARRARGEAVAALGASPGFRDLKRPTPVMPATP